MKKILSIALLSLLIISSLAACTPMTAPMVYGDATPQAASTEKAPIKVAVGSDSQPVKITGEFSYSNDFVVETYVVEQAVALADMTGFIKRDKEYLTTTESQTLGFMQPDFDNNKATYWIQLPIQPEGELNIVDPSGGSDTGVQVFAVSYWPNLAGGPYSEGDDPSYGWPNYLASVKTDTENHDEVTGGKLVIWSPDGKQQFPSGFGDDGLLFTRDDPVMPVQNGWSVIDLDASPFGLSRTSQPDITLYEPTDIAIKDYSAGTYSEAFQKLYDTLKKEYAFNGIEGKEPDWDKLYLDLMPVVQAAESAKDPVAFYLALSNFTWAFNDGHVGLSGGEIENQIFSAVASTGYGFAVRVLDDDSIITTFVTPGGPADEAGVKVGDVLLKIGDKPVMEALKEVKPLSAPFSTDFALEYQQARYLLRAAAGTQTEFVFKDTGGRENR